MLKYEHSRPGADGLFELGGCDVLKRPLGGRCDFIFVLQTAEAHSGTSSAI